MTNNPFRQIKEYPALVERAAGAATQLEELAVQLKQEQAVSAALRGQIEKINNAAAADRLNHQGELNTVMSVLEAVYRGDIPAWMAIATVDKIMKGGVH
ncbi:hypothetical protein [Ensifer sp. B1-9]|uniref:hypothetical protein n=1 Tax=Ensifer sp. B1-9 TaxID=3141455 RepID=UPI003D205ED4